MTAYIVRRLLLLIPTLLAGVLLVFGIMHLAPGDPVLLLAGPEADPRIYEELRQEWGLDKPVYIQCLTYLGNLVRGDLGVSLVTGRPVIADIGAYLPATVELTIFALFLSVVVGVLAGVLSAVRPNTLVDHSTRVASLLGVATPVFWLGLLLIILFHLRLGWLPGGGRIGIDVPPPRAITGLYLIDGLVTGNWTALGSSALHLLMPGFVLAFAQIARVARITRASMLGIVGLDYVKAGKAKGLKESKVVSRYILRNAWIPILTMVGEVAGTLLGGAVVTEVVFSWPGMGRYAVDSIMALDYKAIVAFAIIATTLYALMNLVVDVMYAWVDPRISYSRVSGGAG
ncbi:MAG: ABC transporter permease [Candidatus Bipolaricaulis sp.]|nr:ABC transporter permease [Candidatus Bipolaricaulis sp.]MDD5219630.1 ABC transporter permease [Candidatus Bipolaricaulis sp.]